MDIAMRLLTFSSFVAAYAVIAGISMDSIISPRFLFHNRNKVSS